MVRNRTLENRIAELEKALRVKNEMKHPARIHADTASNALAKAKSDIGVLLDYIYAVNGKGVFEYSDDVVDTLARAKDLVSQANILIYNIYSKL